MDIITRASSLNSEHQAILAQGASYILSTGDCQLGVWTENTPEHEGAVDFLISCVHLLKKKHPGRTILGPMNGNTWMKHRLIVETNEHAPFTMEPIEPIELLDIFKAAGFTALSSYSSSSINLLKPQRNFQKIAKLVERKGIVIRPIAMENFEQELESIYELSLLAFANNFLYTPIARELFMQSYVKIKSSSACPMKTLRYYSSKHSLLALWNEQLDWVPF